MSIYKRFRQERFGFDGETVSLIDMKATGKSILSLRKHTGYSVKALQTKMGLGSP